ncbi:MAG: glycosyltransferase family 2 protein [Chitinophagales bacterium]|nr:glycosyltransferase family 2 protein [Chitinophagaceae bacterium]MCB9065064.1 glycosyltransferase family 2 protein [Chitinophagales bacterium]
MKVSIIMCSYNSAEYIGKAIDCILAQTYTDWELIISDDKSTDNSAEIIQPYLSDPRIRLIIQEKNLGYVKNKNFALSKGTAPLLTQLDSDDMCPPDRLEKQVNVFLNNPNIKVCGSDFAPIDTKDNFLSNVHEFNEYRDKYTEDFLIEGPQLKYPFWFPGLMFRKEILDEIGYFSEYFNGIYGDDHYWAFKISQKYPIYFLKDVLYYYRINPGSITNVLDDPRKLIAQDLIAELHRLIIETGTDWLEQGKPEEGRAFEEALFKNKPLMAQRYRMWAAKAIDKKNWVQAKDLLKKHFSCSKTDVSGYRTLLYYLRSRYLS